MRRAAADTGARGGFAHRCDDLGVARETEIIVAAEVDESLPFDNDVGTILFDRKRFDRSLPSPQMLAIDLGQRRLKR
jgi:hypothetical protein